jgi:hypothetical protein
MDVNIKIQTVSGKRLDYTTPESLNIKFNRVIDDYNKPDKRFGEFSYTFSLPKTKNNNRIFGTADVYTVVNKFKINPIEINVFNFDELLLSGILEVYLIKEKTYECRFYSKLTQLVDSLQDVMLNKLTTTPQIDNWNYEVTMRDHINADYKNSDEASYQFPLVFYNTFHTPYSVYSGNTDFEGYYFPDDGDRPQQNFYYMLNRVNTDNEWYFHQLPLTFYLKKITEYLLKEVGWSLSGSFWETPEAKEMIMLYTGEEDIYDIATYIGDTGSLMLDTAKFLPEMSGVEFLNSIINMFNLYLIVDVNNKILKMETYDVLFNNRVSPIILDKKIKAETITIERIENYDYTIKYNDPLNKNHLGDNYIIKSVSNNAYTTNYVVSDEWNYDEVYTHVGTTGSETTIGFGAPMIKRMYIRNREDYDSNHTGLGANDNVIFMPQVSEQNRYDNKNIKFNKRLTDTTVYNDETTIKFKGKPTIMYYYGISNSEFIQHVSKTSDYFYVDFDNVKQKIGIASPFGYRDYRNIINNNIPLGNEYASYLQSIYLNMGDNFDREGYSYSLTFGDSGGMCDTLFTKFYANRFNRYRNSEILNASIKLTSLDWKNMVINQPLKYNGELYSLIEIKNYDIVKGTASIKLIKMI